MNYAPLHGYASVTLSDDTLEQWRNGRSAASPAEAQALVRALDEALMQTTPTTPSLLALMREMLGRHGVTKVARGSR